MNDFGIVLPVGTHGIYKAARFFKGYLPHDKKVPEAGRTFVIKGGVGREPTPGSRKITGHWLDDNMPDTIDTYSLEAVVIGDKRIKQIIKGDPPPEPVTAVEEEVIAKRTNKPRGRSAWKEDEHGD